MDLCVLPEEAAVIEKSVSGQDHRHHPGIRSDSTPKDDQARTATTEWRQKERRGLSRHGSSDP